jgi:AcrR family transcriptional regulator
MDAPKSDKRPEVARSESASPRRSRREERKEETRAELISAAARVFARGGFHGASVEQIAAEAGYTTGAIYWHFSGKEDLFLAVYETFAAGLATDIQDVFAYGEGDLAERAREAARRWMARVDRDPEFLILAHEFLVHAWRQPQLRAAFADRIASIRLALSRVIAEEARAEGRQLVMSAEDLGTVMRALGSALGLARLADPGAVRDDLFADVAARLFEAPVTEIVGKRGRPAR